MNRTLVWAAVGVVVLVVLGMVLVKVVAVLVKLLFSALIVLALVGGALYLLGRVRTAVRGGRFRQIRRR